MSVCRSCGADIQWAKTRNGSLMPLDVEPNPLGSVELDDDGRAIVVTGDPDLFGRPRYATHFQTCPNADQHRGRR